MSNIVNCLKLKIKENGLEKPPFSGKIGNKIFKNISAKAWNEWINFQIKLINEEHLDLMELENRQKLAVQMKKFLCFKSIL